MNLSEISIVGMGGIGCALLPLVSRFALFEHYTVHLVDGDAYEERNLNRQVFPSTFVGMNKALAQETKLKTVMPSLKVYSTTDFLTEANAYSSLAHSRWIFTGVDNHRARYVVSRAFQRMLRHAIEEDTLTSNGMWLITCGNNKWDGNVHIYGKVKRGNEIVTYGEPVEQRHTEMSTEMHGSREDLSCQDLINIRGGEQTMLANTMVATLAFMLFSATIHHQNALEGLVDTYFDCAKLKISSVRINNNTTKEGEGNDEDEPGSDEDTLQLI